MDFPRPYKKFERRVVVALAVSLLAGILIGVALDRTFLHLFSKGSARSKLVGQWADTTNADPLEFKSDGTFTTTIPLMGVGVPDVGRQPVLGQWRWLDDDSIEMNGFGHREDKARVVIDGDVLKLLRPNGDVKVYRRK
jgi:hypothetical protein